MARRIAGIAVAVALAGMAVADSVKIPGVGEVVVPSSQVQHFLDLEVVAIVHYGLNTYANKEWGFGDTPASIFNPTKLDTDQWVRAAKDGGIKRIIMVCKHHDGFCLWPSKLNKDYTIANTPWKDGKGDLVKEVRASTLKYGLEFAAYLSPWDRHHAEYARPAYTEYFHDQWADLMDNYGPITEIWLDGANGGDGWYGGNKGVRKLPGGAAQYYDFKRLLDNLFRKSEKAVVFGGGMPNPRQVTWPGNERGQVAEEYNFVREGCYCPPEADTPMRTSGWFWHKNGGPKSLRELTDRYFESVGRGGVLDLGLAPNTDGLLDEADVQRLKEFGAYIRAFNKKDFIKGATASKDSESKTFTFVLKAPSTFNAVDIRENLAKGMRVKGWEVLADGEVIARGKLIANRRIVRFNPVTARTVVLRITECEGRPAIKGFALRWAPDASGNLVDFAEGDYVEGAKSVVSGKTTLTIDLGKVHAINGFDYMPQQTGVRGMVAGYQAEVSVDGKKWKQVDEGEFGNLRANPILQAVRFATVKARYVRILATKAIEGEPVWKNDQIKIVK